MIATELPTQSKTCTACPERCRGECSRSIPNLKSPIGKPHYRRTQQVYAVLDSSSPEETYDRLIEYVQVQTGKGCSRKLISKWKKLTIQNPNPKSGQIPRPPEMHLVANQDLQNGNEPPTGTSNSPSLVVIPCQQVETTLKTTLENNQGETNLIKNPPSSIALKDDQLPNRVVSSKSKIDSPQNSTKKAEPKAKNSHPIQEKVSQVAKNTWSYVAATAIVVGLAGCGWFLSKDNSQPVIAQTTVITETAPAPRPQKLQPRTIKIDLTLTSPQDLKVKPGDEVTPGTVLSDRSTERQRLLAQKKQLQLSLKKLDLPIPEPTQPKPIPALSKLPPVSYQQEEANIALKEQELAQAEKAIANQEEKINQLHELLSQPEDNPVLSKVPLTIEPQADLDMENESSITATQSKGAETPVALIIEHEQALLQQLATARDKAKLQLDIAKSQLITAKEQRAHAEYQRYLEETKRVIALQQQQIELERQRSIRAGQLQEREYSKAQIETKIQEIDNAITQLSTVKAPYPGKIKKVKWTGQDNHNLTVQLTLDVDNGSEE